MKWDIMGLIEAPYQLETPTTREKERQTKRERGGGLFLMQLAATCPSVRIRTCAHVHTHTHILNLSQSDCTPWKPWWLTSIKTPRWLFFDGKMFWIMTNGRDRMEKKKEISNQKKKKKKRKWAFGCLANIFRDITDYMSRQRTRHQIQSRQFLIHYPKSLSRTDGSFHVPSKFNPFIGVLHKCCPTNRLAV